ncbi:Late embryogenesis abundant protein LEA-1 subgroup protein [Dioscorea alata]|uniref:Late embryogenesis abundant protein LEA-1 subgroup protein n=1 Tax=Dioscorea alata TaxID=55571 RepID=A0ACB7VDD6_DIOAL|nr:Late embryogenesis abundant protein LEA-1 subgroup protein [Dioscorea alata]
MQGAKEKMKDMGSTTKEKLTEFSAKTEEKAEKTTARNKEEKEMVKEKAKAKEAQAKAQLHHEKADHRADSAAAGHRGSTRVPLTHHRPAAGNVTYPASGDLPAGEKYF